MNVSRFARSGPLREAGLLAVGSALLGVLAIQLARQPGSVATVWLANAMGTAFLVSAPRERRWLLLLAVVVGNLSANLWFGDPLVRSLQFALANAAEVGLGYWLIQRWALAPRFSEEPARFLKLVACGALLPQLLGATLGAGILHLQGYGEFWRVWPDWYVGSALGAVLVLPLVLLVRQQGWRAAAAELASLNVAALALATVGLALFAFAALRYPFVYAILPLIAGALLLPVLAAFALCCVLGLTVTVALAVGLYVPFGTVGAWQHLLVYIPALAAVLPPQLLAVVNDQQQRSRATLSALLSATTDLMAYFDLDGKVRVVNRAWEIAWQRDGHDAIGLSPLDLVPADQRSPGMADRVAQALRGDVVHARVRQTLPILGRRSFEVAYQPAYDDNGLRVGVVFTAHDVTDLVQARDDLEATVAELRAANEGLEQFARISAHDLREPLNTIVQFTELIEQDHGTDLPAAARRYFDLVQGGAQRMRATLDDLLQFMRLERGAARPNLESVPLEPLFEQVAAALAARIDQSQAQVRIEPLPPVMGHPSLLSLLFQNLLSNALKFVPADRAPEVVVSARDDGDHVVVAVADNGIGIEERDRAKLFIPFQRLHGRRQFDGTGLGLAICQRIVNSLGGSISVESVAGSGSRFEVRLRRA